MAKSIKLEAPQGKPAAVKIEKPVMPPPERTARGVGGSPPMPVGKPTVVSGGTWKPAASLPEEARTSATKAAQAAREDVNAAANTLPVDPSTPPVKLGNKMVALENTTPEKQAEYRQLISTAALGSEHGQRIAATPWIAADTTPPERPATRHTLDPAEQPQAPAAAQPTPAPDAHHDLAECPNCHWLLANKVETEPTNPDKVAFLQAILGQKSFVRTYTLFDGGLRVTFRNLTIGELDIVFRQVYRERDEGRIQSTQDFFERVSRLRMYLQLQRLQSLGQFDHELPDGLTAETSPNATALWELPEGGKDELMPAIEQYVLNKVLPNESLFRVVMRELGSFNRLAARLEVLSGDDSFWKATGLPSA
jgi:hypothetical protein